MNEFFKSGIGIEDGVDGLYMQITVCRLGRGRGREGFGNAQALKNMFAKFKKRQSDRLTRQRKEGISPDDYHMMKVDLIDRDPSKAILICDSWTKLQKLTGLKSVKESVEFFIDLTKKNHERELEEKDLNNVSVNRVFVGSPGTGKTAAAKL